jgi:NAD(P)-dependent dehydrogenase (short-subunit alcohol dehydrogenase family)
VSSHLGERQEFVVNIAFETKVALVTGAGSGMGPTTAKAFADAGASVVLADSREVGAFGSQRTCCRLYHNAIAVRCDVTDERQVEVVCGALPRQLSSRQMPHVADGTARWTNTAR